MEDVNDKMEEGRPLISFAKKTEDCDVQHNALGRWKMIRYRPLGYEGPEGRRKTASLGRRKIPNNPKNEIRSFRTGGTETEDKLKTTKDVGRPFHWDVRFTKKTEDTKQNKMEYNRFALNTVGCRVSLER